MRHAADLGDQRATGERKEGIVLPAGHHVTGQTPDRGAQREQSPLAVGLANRPEPHSRLVARIFRHRSEGDGTLPVQWFADEVFPALRARHADLRFYIVGSRPAPAVQALGQRPGIVVTGTVPDVRPYIAHAAVAVAPLRIARGIQNKVLEAMAMATPVVVSPQALEGIDAVPGSELVLAGDAPAFAAAVGALLDGQASASAAIGQAARAKVQRQYSWSSNLACIGENLECS